MNEDTEATENAGDLDSDEAAASLASDALPSAEFVKVEKNLASLGFFTPSSKRLRNAQEKSFTITTVADGKRLVLKGTIIPSAKYGLPITADQDKWIALCKILTDIMRKEGSVTNPVSFTSAEILRLLRKHRHSGKNYREVEEWLDVLFSTTIFSEGVVYLANEKRRVKDRFRVFERAVSFGKELPGGKVADKNYVWFSDWQLQNINSNYLLPIELEAYRQLKNHIAKALVPLLQIWLYATRDEGVFEKRYDELCALLNIQQYRYLSLISRTLAPSLDELKRFGYLADWQVGKTSDGESYKIVFHHGEKFHRDRRARLAPRQANGPALDRRPESAKAQSEPLPADNMPPRLDERQKPDSGPASNEEYLAALLKRGVTEKHARTILADISPEQPVIAQLEWGDEQVRLSGNRIANPAGFYISLVRGNIIPPPTFATSAERETRAGEERRQEEVVRAQRDAKIDYERYREDEIRRHLASLGPEALSTLIEAKRQEHREKYPRLPSETNDRFAEIEARHELEKQTPLITFDEFNALREQRIDPSKNSVTKPLAPSIEPVARGATDTVVTDGSPSEDRTAAGESRETAMPGPMIMLASEPHNESSDAPNGPSLA